MTERQESDGVPPMFTDEQAPAWMDERALAWMEEHLTELKESVSGQRILYWTLVIAFVIGLAAHVGGYVLLSSAASGLLGLLADLLHALGWSLWTGVVVAVFVQIIPEVKRRQIKQAVEAYEALRREKAQADGNRAGAALEKPHARRAEREQGPQRHRNRTRRAG